MTPRRICLGGGRLFSLPETEMSHPPGAPVVSICVFVGGGFLGWAETPCAPAWLHPALCISFLRLPLWELGGT